MAGYFIYSLDAGAFEQLTTSPTEQQALLLADSLLDDRGLEDLLEDYGDDGVDPSKWPLDRESLADRIRQRLAASDWYADLGYGDAVIWDGMLHSFMEDVGEKLRLDYQCENDGFLYWDAAAIAARHGAPMMAEPKFGGRGFRYSGKSQGDTGVDLMYSFYLPAQTRILLNQLEQAVPYFESLPDEEEGDRDQFFQGLLEPVKKIVEAGRVMWVQTDT